MKQSLVCWLIYVFIDRCSTERQETRSESVCDGRVFNDLSRQELNQRSPDSLTLNIQVVKDAKEKELKEQDDVGASSYNMKVTSSPKTLR